MRLAEKLANASGAWAMNPLKEVVTPLTAIRAGHTAARAESSAAVLKRDLAEQLGMASVASSGVAAWRYLHSESAAASTTTQVRPLLLRLPKIDDDAAPVLAGRRS
jgi:hypothetical protein